MEKMWKVLKMTPTAEVVSNYGAQGDWKARTKKKCTGPLKPCQNGFHASDSPSEAWLTVNGTVIAQVAGHGEFSEERQKVCYREMEVLKAWEVKEANMKEMILAYYNDEKFRSEKAKDVLITLLLRDKAPTSVELKLLSSNCSALSSLLTRFWKKDYASMLNDFSTWGPVERGYIDRMVLNLVASGSNQVR